MTFESTTSNAVYALNHYTSKLLKENLGWDSADYQGGSFIIGLAQQPEYLKLAQPFIIYGSTVGTSSHLYQHRRESVAYTIFSTTVRETNDIVELITRTFERQDEAATDINRWLEVVNVNAGVDEPTFEDVAFTSIRVTMAQKGEPATEEGGFIAATIMFEIRYVMLDDLNIITGGFTYP